MLKRCKAVHWQAKGEQTWSLMVLNVAANVHRTRPPSETSTVGKKAHTDKNLVLVNTHSQKVVNLSPTQPGKKHNKKHANPQAIVYPPNVTLGNDTGCQYY